ncbi:MAG: fatty acyl-AMP ligase [Alphaproteobacteria bacterium]|nr:MAG: fatty acyl-AMP ligase [Alphaproteobacteria bacterium]
MNPTPTSEPTLPRRMADFETLSEALDYAANGECGLNFYSMRGELETVLPYAELQKNAVDYAKRLMNQGLKRGDRVALVADVSADFCVAFFACQYAGLIAVPLPIPISFGGREGYIRQLRQQLESSGASSMLMPVVVVELSEEAAAGLGLRMVISYPDILDLPVGDVALQPSTSTETSYLQYSSGSTRFPHGVTILQSAAVNNCRLNAVHGVQIRDGDRMMSWLPFYHDMGLVGGMLTLVMTQMSVDFLPTEYFARRPMMWLEIMSRNKSTICYAPGFGYELVSRRANDQRIAELDLSAWRVAGLGAEMIRAPSVREFAKVFAPAGFRAEAFVPSYGLAECTLAVSFMPLDVGIEVDIVDEAALSDPGKAIPATDQTEKIREVVNCGIPMPEFDVVIRDEDGQSCPDRDIGTLYVRGTSVMSGYHDDPETTRSVLDDEGWLDTGDMAYFLNGAIYIVGRAKDLIILNGQNLWPQDIEWSVEQIEGQRNDECVAISVPGPKGEEVAMLLVQTRTRDLEKRSNFVKEVKDRIRKQLGINCLVALVNPRALPRTSSGKLSRSKAREAFLSQLILPEEGSDPFSWDITHPKSSAGKH